MKFVRMLVLGSLAFQAGAAVSALQVWAWASMVRSGQTVAQAVEGRAPCRLCHRLRRGGARSSLSPRTFSPLRDWALPKPRQFMMASPAVPRKMMSPVAVSAAPQPVDFPPPRLLTA